MDMYGFYTGKIFDAYEYLGAHITNEGVRFRVFAPNALKVSVIGEFSSWMEVPMESYYDGNFYEAIIDNAYEGMKYKYRIYENGGKIIDHCDPYGYGMELRPHNASIIRNLNRYEFADQKWMRSRNDHKKKAMNIYELHLGSWKTNSFHPNGWYTYEEIGEQLIPYVKENGYNYIEVMPISEYPADESWGYQATGFYSPTSRYGDAQSLMKLIDACHQNGIGVILDFVPVHFAVDDYALANFDGVPLYEYPHRDVGDNEWGSKNFAHSRGEVRSFLQSAANYWLTEFHFDGLRMDAISNMLYWQGDPKRGVNGNAVEFLKVMNEGIKERHPTAILLAEDSTSYLNITKKVAEDGLGFDYKWDMGWMNDTLEFFKKPPGDRKKDYHKLTFSMMYFYDESFLLPLSHDEVVHGKETIVQKMNGSYEEKFAQARALYMYMYAHPGKKLNFMGNEIGQLREWDEKREQDWEITKFPIHDAFHKFMIELNHVYLKNPALFEQDYDKDGFKWIDCNLTDQCVYSFIRKSQKQKIAVVLNFSNEIHKHFPVRLLNVTKASLILDSSWKQFGGNTEKEEKVLVGEGILMTDLAPYSGKFYVVS